jgi:hypothetical protein
MSTNSKNAVKMANNYAIQLAESLTEISLDDFFKEIHSRFYPTYDISFMEFFMKIIKRDGECCIEHTLLNAYGVLTTTDLSHIKEKLENHDLVENDDFVILKRQKSEFFIFPDVRENENRTGRKPKFYYLTPDAFKDCLMGTQTRSAQRVNSRVYRNYFKLFEKVHDYFKTYETLYANKVKQILSNENNTLKSRRTVY